MMTYRSDWPEAGLGSPWTPVSESALPIPTSAEWSRSAYDGRSDVTFQLRGVLNGFETEFYQIPCWELRMEAVYPEDETVGILDSPSLQDGVKNLIFSLLSEPPAEQAYVYAKVVAGEPLHVALTGAGFEAVEHRRLFKCKIVDLVSGASSEIVSGISYLTLAQLPENMHAYYRDQILDICKESFQMGNSRHFRDAYLSERISGIEYILAVMSMNFAHVAANGFLLAVDHKTGEVSGFSVVGKKPTLQEETYTQLLSAVRLPYRGRGVYRGLTRLLLDTFAKNATLLNVTHAQTEAIQRAYQDSGRIHLADTLVIRRIFDATSPS